MGRPRAIVLFERLYLAGWLAGLGGTLLSWNATLDALLKTPEVAEIGPTFLYATTAIRLIIPLVLWYLIARRGSVVAKWLATGFFALGAVGVLIALFRGAWPSTAGALLGYLAFALQLAAIVMLFRPEAAPWFGTSDVDAPA